MVNTTAYTHQSPHLPRLLSLTFISHLFSQTPSLWSIMDPVVLLGFLCYVKASPGTPIKMSSSATQRLTTWLWLKCLKVHRDVTSMKRTIKISVTCHSLCGLWSLLRHSEASVLAEACVWACSHWTDKQRLHQWWPDHMDEGGSLPQLQEALWGFIQNQQALH